MSWFGDLTKVDFRIRALLEAGIKKKKKNAETRFLRERKIWFDREKKYNEIDRYDVL